MKKIIFIVIFCAIYQSYGQVPEPVKAQQKGIALMNGTAHIGNGTVIQNSVVLFEKGKLVAVADAPSIKLSLDDYDKINVAGKHIYPGLILPSTNLGLEDISAVRATRDYEEVGDFNPNVRSVVAYNTDAEMIATFRYNGILLAQVAPYGGVIGGTSSIMALEGWNWEDAAYLKDDAIYMYWPQKTFPPRWWMSETQPRANPDYKPTVEETEKFFIDAKSYHTADKKDATNIKFEAMKGIFSGEKRLCIYANKRDQIIESIQFAKKMGVTKIVLVGASDAIYTIDFLKENNISVLLTSVHRLPSREDEEVYLPYRLPSILHKAGVLVGLMYDDDLHHNRNLPFFAGTAAAHSDGNLSQEQALSLITSNTAKILGIDNRTGTLEVGKDANIVVSEGDILDMKTSKVTHAFILGKKLNLDGKQQMLYERFKKKYEGK
ncbi:MAG: amidohydrolase family protein [Chitinophagaceae bacterium]|nr:amidohydrolase family protein [Chitinophagaceae bacterium]